MLTYFLISIAVVNVLAVVVTARLGRRLSGTTDELWHPVVRRGADPIIPATSYALRGCDTHRLHFFLQWAVCEFLGFDYADGDDASD